MRICKISEILNRVGEQITGVSGTLTKVFPVKSGEGRYGKWTLQDGMIEDDSGKIPVTFANLSDQARLKGAKITITANQGDKGINGLQVKNNSYKDKTGKDISTIKLHVTGAAFIDSGVEHAGQDASPAQPETAGQAIPADADPEERAALELLARKKAEKLAAEAAAKARAQSPVKTGSSQRKNQIINLYDEATQAAVYISTKRQVPFCHEMVATLFIAFRDDGLTEFQLPSTAELVRQEISDPAVQADPVEDIDQEQPATWQEVKLHLEHPSKGQLLGDLNDEELEYLFNTFRPVIDPKTKTYAQRDVVLMGALKTWKVEAI